jgi:hypothetical protein
MDNVYATSALLPGTRQWCKPLLGGSALKAVLAVEFGS